MKKIKPQIIDHKIRSRLKTFSEEDRNYWAFRKSTVREHMHACFQYPAMMVPTMQERLINTFLEVLPDTKRVYEPFIGSGTAMIEVMKKGLDFTGQDINPLAVLLCRTKSGPFYEDSLNGRTNELMNSIKTDRRTKIEADFATLNKWFRDDVAYELSKIRRAIRKEKYLWCRRFYWVVLAETVRLTSNSRTTTFKLHIRPRKEIRTRRVSPIDIFSNLLEKNLMRFSRQKALLRENNSIHKGLYKGNIEIRLRDSSVSIPDQDKSRFHDLLITSPPYGDNKTTIPYGQHSFLPLQWIDLEDIDNELDEDWLATSYEIDRRSLGGSLRKASKDIPYLIGISKSLRRTFRKLKDYPEERKLRVAAFWRDFNRCIEPTLAALKPNAYMIWIVGNRNVAGQSIPMNDILSELLTSKGAELVESIRRIIPSKRMAAKNNVSVTMSSETILIMRKGPA